jgi:hypothetical protein
VLPSAYPQQSVGWRQVVLEQHTPAFGSQLLPAQQFGRFGSQGILKDVHIPLPLPPCPLGMPVPLLVSPLPVVDAAVVVAAVAEATVDDSDEVELAPLVLVDGQRSPVHTPDDVEPPGGP